MVSQEDAKLFPFGFKGSLYGKGRKDNRHRSYTGLSLDYRTVLSHAFSSNFTTETAFGAQGTFTSDYRIFGQGLDFPAPGVSTVGAGARTTSTETRIREVNAGALVQETIGLMDRLFLTAGARIDGNSAFGSEFRTQLYPKVSVAYNVSQESFWPTSFWPSMKLRMAWGTSGLAPAQFAADRTYLAVAALAGEPAVTPGNLGDPDLAPEKSSELELGFDAGFFEDRLGLVVTYYDQTTTDALIPAQFPPSSGFLETQLKNIGEIQNRGVEAGLQALLITGEQITLDSDIQLTWSENEVTSMGDAAPIRRHVVNSLEVREGYPVSSFWAPKVIGWDAERRTHITTDTAVYQGTDMPNFYGSFGLNLGLLGRLNVSARADWATGHRHNNVTRMFRIQYRTGDEYLATVERPSGAPTAASDSLLDFIVAGGTGSYIEKADFLKIRELAVSYAIPDAWLGRLGLANTAIRLSARNLHTFTGYQGSDPETSWDGTDGFNTGAEFFTVPPARRISLAFRTTF
jgi:outer membrane receptor protein involved in Fe transport